jgi:DNA-binding MarR family transcriptional regulator
LSRPDVGDTDLDEADLGEAGRRQRRREVYQDLAANAGVPVAPRTAWLLLCVGEHPGWGRHDLAVHLHMTDADLDRRLADLVKSGYARPLPGDLSQPVPLSEQGQRAFESLFRVRRERIARLAADWDPDQHPHLVALLTRLTHQLGASEETLGHDLDTPARPVP